MTAAPGVPRPCPRDAGLSVLLANLLAARAALTVELAHPGNRPGGEGRSRLLTCLEAYSVALTARHLPIPPRIRDDLRLHRQFFRSREEEHEGRARSRRW